MRTISIKGLTFLAEGILEVLLRQFSIRVKNLERLTYEIRGFKALM